jgi:DNA-binding NtrC family response regulator
MHKPAVLIVEDEPLVRMMMADLLQDKGLKVLEAADAEEAVDAMVALDGIELVFTDVQFPSGRDGVALAGWIKREKPQLKVVVTSGTANPDRIRDELSRSSTPFIEKPYDMDDVAEHLAHLVTRTNR